MVVGNNPLCPLDKLLGGPQAVRGLYRMDISLPLPGNELRFRGRLSCNLFATGIYWAMPVAYNFDTDAASSFYFQRTVILYTHHSFVWVASLVEESDALPSSRADPQVRFTPSSSRKTRVPYQALHISHHHHVLIVAGIRMALLSVGKKIALFKRRSTFPCIGWLVVIYQRPLLLFCRRKLVGVFSGCKQERYKIRHIITQGIILLAVDFSDFRSRYQSCYEKLT
jgi:hypothetical protein